MFVASSSESQIRTSAAGQVDSSIPTRLKPRAGETASTTLKDANSISRRYGYFERFLYVCAATAALEMLQWLQNGQEARPCDCGTRYVYIAIGWHTGP